MKIYTKKGDKGETAIFYGLNINKHSLRVECLGSLDELNASLGFSLSIIQNKEIILILKNVQNTLFHIGAELAKIQKSENINTKFLEDTIDNYQNKLPELKNFIIPSGSQSSCSLHVARTICRRAERNISELYQTEDVPESTLSYLNRLSDLLFILARCINHEQEIKEEIWRC